MSESGEPAARVCQWCGASADDAATKCPSCGAALAERESLGGLVVPGVTTVDPALAAYDAQPLRIRGSSPSQGLAGGTVAAAALGGPAGLAALGGLAAVAAVEYLGAGSDQGGSAPALADVGRPSEAALRMAERLDAGEDPGEDPGQGKAGDDAGEADPRDVSPRPGS